VLGLLGIAKRVTFVLDREGRIVERIEGMSPGPHVQRSLERLASLAPPGRSSPDGPTTL
jgi:peroxiredoxin